MVEPATPRGDVPAPPVKPAAVPDGAAATSPDPTGGVPATEEAVDAVRALAQVSRVLERASGELSLAHYRVLSAIASGNERASRIAARLALGKPTVSSTVETLCQRGLLLRAEAKGDQRAVSLKLTVAGRALLEKVEADMVRRIDDLCARTPDPATTRRTLAWLGEAMNPAPSAGDSETRTTSRAGRTAAAGPTGAKGR